ncbi:hypothetical protein ES702_02809 [subsurface metagenome]
MNCKKCNQATVQFMINKFICINEFCELHNLIQEKKVDY